MWKALPLALLALPGLAQASEQCKFQAARSLAPDLSGVRTVVIEVGSHDFHVKSGSKAKVDGRACASSQSALDKLQLSQRREGDRLVIGTGKESSGWLNGGLFGEGYANLDVNVVLPKSMPVVVAVGSGDADVDGMGNVDSSVGSGDLEVRNADRLGSSVGSGDLKAGNVGSVEIDSIGSGDFEAHGIRGNASIGSIGSGDADLDGVGGHVEVRSIGSGSLSVAGVGGDLRVHSVGSGDVDHRDVKGRVDIPREN